MTVIEIVAIFSGVSMAIATLLVGMVGTRNDRIKFYEDKITDLLAIQSNEIKQLREEIDRLISENQTLTMEVSKLKSELEKRGVHYDNII